MLQDDTILQSLLEQLQIPPKTTQSKECPMVTIRQSLRDPKNETDCFVFPPVNHENLQIPSHNNNPEQQNPSSKSSPPSLSLSPSDLRSKEVIIGWLDFGFEVLRAKICSIFSLFCNNDGPNRGALSSFGRVAGMAVVVIWWWLWRRRRSQRESVEHLKLVIKERDEKILQLLRQIAQMNEVLVGRHKVLASKLAD